MIPEDTPPSQTGYYQSEIEAITDWDVADRIYDLCSRNDIKTLVDFGCGHGIYVNYLKDRGIDAEGYDGNPITLKYPNCYVLDLSSHFDFGKYDCVLSLEVGEHMPEAYEQPLLDNLVKHTGKLLILSWALPGPGGFHHVNCRENAYIKAEVAKRGLTNLPDEEDKIRAVAKHWWFRNTVMVFKS